MRGGSRWPLDANRATPAFYRHDSNAMNIRTALRCRFEPAAAKTGEIGDSARCGPQPR